MYKRQAYVFYEVNKFVTRESFRLPQYCSVFQAEIKAIKEAASALLRTEKYKFVRFFIDSQAAIKALDSREITSCLVRDAKNELNKAARNRRITLYWTRAHIGTEGNEFADRAAKEGGQLALVEDIAMPKVELHNKIREMYYEQ